MKRLATAFTLAVAILGSSCSDRPEADDAIVAKPTVAVEAKRRVERIAETADRETLAHRIRTLGVPEDRLRLAKNCLDGAMNACESLGDTYRAGLGVEKDPATTQLFYDFTRLLAEANCTDRGESVQGCAQLGRMHFEGRGVRQNREWGTKLLRKGCAGGDNLACAYLENEGLADSDD